jgi:biotin carboxylase
MPPHVILLTPARTYRAEAFLRAAAALGIGVTSAVDMDPRLAAAWGVPLAIDFADPAAAAAQIAAFAAGRPVAAVLAVDDSGTLLAALASAALGLPHNSPEAALAARDKHRMRQRLREAGLPTPPFRLASAADDPAALAGEIPYPCVVKPLLLSGSRGVIRADDPDGFVAAFHRTGAIAAAAGGAGPAPILVEGFIPGREVALEGLLTGGQLTVLALFDKPDPLDGPFFEETLYVTPSRLPTTTQSAIAAAAQAAAAALGLREGPIHAELRVSAAAPWILEVAGRSIGGLCSRILSFGTGASLEELILRHACGLPIDPRRAAEAVGVMMIPIPAAGLLRGVTGIAAAEAVPGIREVRITAPVGYPVVPLPEGGSYLGFIFAEGRDPAAAEASLRAGHAALRIQIVPEIPVIGDVPASP